MDQFVIHAQTSIPWQKRYQEALLNGLQKYGAETTATSGQDTGPGTHIILGPNCFKPAYAQLRGQNRHVITVNRAFIGEVLGHQKDPYVAIGWDGYNNLARFPFEYEDQLPYSRALRSFWEDLKPARGRTGPRAPRGPGAT